MVLIFFPSFLFFVSENEAGTVFLASESCLLCMTNAWGVGGKSVWVGVLWRLGVGWWYDSLFSGVCVLRWMDE